MHYVGILLAAVMISFIIVRIGGFALYLTGIESEVATFQALSAFTGTGFTTRESERVVDHVFRRRIVSVLMILGNAGLVTIVATLVASFTQVSGYSWFFIRLGIIVAGILVLYQLIVKSKAGNRILNLFRRPIMKSILRQAPAVEEVLNVGEDWVVALVTVKDGSSKIGMTLAKAVSETDARILAIDRPQAAMPNPSADQTIEGRDRLLVYAQRASLKDLVV